MKIEKQKINLVFYYLIMVSINFLFFTFSEKSPIFLYFLITESVFFQWIIPLTLLKNRLTDIFSPFILFLFLFQLFYLIHPIFITIYGPTLNISKDIFNTTFAIKMFFFINIAVLSFYMGYLIKSSRDVSKKLPPELPTRWYLYGQILSILFVLSGFLSFFLIIKSDPIYFFTHLGRRTFFISGHGFLFLMSFFSPIGMIMFFYFSYLKNKKITFLTIVLTGFFLIVYLFEGSRGHVFVPILVILMIYHYKIKKIRLRKIMFLSFFIFLLFFLFHVFRSYYIKKEYEKSMDIKLRGIITKMFYSTEQYVVILTHPLDIRFYGRNYLHSVLIFVPKFIWKNKPNFSIVKFYNEYFFPKNKEFGITYNASLLGTSILNFGENLFFLEFILFGVLLKILYCKMLRVSRIKFIGYSLLIVTLIFFSVSRNFASAISMLTFFLLPFLIFVFVFQIIIYLSSNEN